MSKTGHYKIIVLFLLVRVLAVSQNLVPNGDFEIYSQCPTMGGQINYSTGWTNAEPYTTPDYLNACNGGNYSVPLNVYGFQPDYGLGSGYAGIYVFNKYFPDDGRDYIQIKLMDTLVIGRKYLATMYASQCDKYNYAIATLGMYFTSTAIQGPTNVGFMNIPNPQVKNSSPLIDTINWIQIQDTVVGTGVELYLTIGNFNADSVSDTVKVFNMFNQPYSYYYIDKVSVIDVATIGITEEGMETSSHFFPNPSNGLVRLDHNLASDASLEIRDINGNLVYSAILKSNANSMDLNLDKLGNGVYFYRVTNKEATLKTGKLVIIH
jgi:hypothetical protein